MGWHTGVQNSRAPTWTDIQPFRCRLSARSHVHGVRCPESDRQFRRTTIFAAQYPSAGRISNSTFNYTHTYVLCTSFIAIRSIWPQFIMKLVAFMSVFQVHFVLQSLPFLTGVDIDLGKIDEICKWLFTIFWAYACLVMSHKLSYIF